MRSVRNSSAGASCGFVISIRCESGDGANGACLTRERKSGPIRIPPDNGDEAGALAVATPTGDAGGAASVISGGVMTGGNPPDCSALRKHRELDSWNPVSKP